MQWGLGVGTGSAFVKLLLLFLSLAQVNWSSTILGDKEAAQYLWGGAVHW